MTTLKTSLAYFAGVFSIGFILGVIRVALVVERIGERWAELLEMPLMIAASYLVARICIKRFGPFNSAELLFIGVAALLMMVATELGLTLAMGQSIADYFAGRDLISGVAYLLALLLFAAMPLIAGRSQGRDGPV